MSAFIVSEGTMHNVVTTILSFRDTFDGLTLNAQTDWAQNGAFSTPELRALATEIGRRLFMMNEDAFCSRYREVPVYNTAQAYSYREQPHLTREQGYQSLRCLLYQCSEGDIDSRPLFAELEAVKNEIACKIVNGLPAMRETEWDAA